MEKHEYIRWVEKNESKFFSEMKISFSLPVENFEKLERVYLKAESESKNWINLIFKTDLFYLYLSKEKESPNYSAVFYFELKNLDRVNIYVSSILKKEKNANANITGTTNQIIK